MCGAGSNYVILNRNSHFFLQIRILHVQINIFFQFVLNDDVIAIIKFLAKTVLHLAQTKNNDVDITVICSHRGILFR